MGATSRQGTGSQDHRRRRRSRTASAAAVLRAIGNHERDPDLHNPDDFAIRLLDPSLRMLVRVPVLRAGFVRFVDWVMPGSYHFLTARTKHLDQILLDEVHSGVKQVVILGAGADSRAYRLTDELAGVALFELDHPLTSRWKQDHLLWALGRVPDHVRYVTVDLDRDTLDDALGVTDRDAPVVIVWEGVTPYLDPDAIAATLAAVGRCAPGSSIAFDYFYRDGDAEPARAEPIVRRLGEPWQRGLEPHEIGPLLAAHGLRLVSNVLSTELAARHLGGKGAIALKAGIAHGRR